MRNQVTIFGLLTVSFAVLAASGPAWAQNADSPTTLRWREMLQYSKQYGAKGYSRSEINPYGKGANTFYPTYLRHAVPLEQEMTLEKLMETINTKDLRTIESVIEALPDNMKNDNYVLMYRSRSLQESTPKSPRAILYTPTASFMLTFNGGDPAHRGSNTLELIQFRLDQRRFEFREITFDGINKPVLSQANPAKCMECHQSPTRRNIDMRPNWDPYSHWIGAFGSDAGDFSTRPLLQSIKEKIQPQDIEALQEQVHEFEMFKTYIHEIAPAHPRFKLLGSFNLHAPVDLTEHLTVWNFMRVMRLILEDRELYALNREALALGAICHSDSTRMRDERAFKWLLSGVPPRYYEYRGLPLSSVSSVLTTLFEPLGVDTSDWSMDFFNGGRFAFYERFGTPSNTSNHFRYAWRQVMPDAEELSKIPCDELRKTALGKLTTALDSGELESIRRRRKTPAPTGAQILQRCMNCHADVKQGWIPHIPFDRPEALGPLLSKPRAARGSLFDEILYRTSDMATKTEQMPPSKRLSQEEQGILIRYLKESMK